MLGAEWRRDQGDWVFQPGDRKSMTEEDHSAGLHLNKRGTKSERVKKVTGKQMAGDGEGSILCLKKPKKTAKMESKIWRHGELASHNWRLSASSLV
jgi:hypothetical protein